MNDLKKLPFKEFGVIFEIHDRTGLFVRPIKSMGMEDNKRWPEIKNYSISLDIKIIVK
jgi:hypothetical protein